MSDNVALITGGAKGIGRGIALDLAAKHWKIALCYRTSEAAAKETAAAIVERGGQALSLRCDVSDPAAAQQLVVRVEQEPSQQRELLRSSKNRWKAGGRCSMPISIRFFTWPRQWRPA